MNAIIVDDEAHGRSALQKLCETYCPDLQIIGTASTVQEARHLIDTLEPHLVFLDIQMPFESGLNLLGSDTATAKPYKIIFTTAYSHYAIQAFGMGHVISYLLKPINIGELEKAVQKAKGWYDQTQLPPLHQRHIDDIGKIALATYEGFTFVKANEIIRCEAQGNYTTFYLTNEQSLLITKTLKHYEDILQDHDFFRIHKSHLINLNYVRKFIRGKQGLVEMSDGKTLEVSFRRRSALLDRLSEEPNVT